MDTGIFMGCAFDRDFANAAANKSIKVTAGCALKRAVRQPQAALRVF